MAVGKNEAEAFQILVVPDDAGLPQVSVQPPTLTNEDTGIALPATAVRVFRSGSVNLTQLSRTSAPNPARQS